MLTRRQQNLTDVVREVWSGPALAKLRLWGASVDLRENPYRIVITGRTHVTVWPLDPPWTSGDRSLCEYMDREMVAACRAHAEPYALYPETQATDEMAFCLAA